MLQIDEIEIEPGGYSSEHLHQHKSNAFFILEGSLQIFYLRGEINFKNSRSCELSFGYDSLMLKANTEQNHLTIPPNVRHQFSTEEFVRAVEVYHIQSIGPYYKIQQDDIVRFSENGRLDHGQEGRKEPKAS